MTLEAVKKYCSRIRANKQVRRLIESGTLNTQHSTLNTQHSTLNTQHSTLNTQHSTLNTQQLTLNTQQLKSITKHLDSIFTLSTEELKRADGAVVDMHRVYFTARAKLANKRKSSKQAFIATLENILKTESFLGEISDQKAKLAAGPTDAMWMLNAEQQYINIGPPPPVTINFFKMDAAPTNEPKKAPRAGLEVELTKISSKKGKGKVSWKQFSALYDACGRGGSWWPTADRDWDAKKLFKSLENYILYDQGKPIGFASLDRNIGDNTVKGVYIGIIPSMQGDKAGSYLFDQMLRKAWQGGTKQVILDTVPEFDLMQRRDGSLVPAAEFYKRVGFKLDPNKPPETLIPGAPDTSYNQFNLPKYWDKNGINEEKRLARRFSSKNT